MDDLENHQYNVLHLWMFDRAQHQYVKPSLSPWITFLKVKTPYFALLARLLPFSSGREEEENLHGIDQ